MNKLYAIKIKQADGNYGAAIPICALAQNIDWNNTLTLTDILGQVDTSVSIQDQINNLKNTKANQTAINALETKINNAIEFSTHDNEIRDARIGIDGSSYNSIKQRLDAEYTIHSNEIINIQNTVTEEIEEKIQEVEENVQNIIQQESESQKAKNIPQNITIAVADWSLSGSLFVVQKTCNKATTDNYNALTFIPQNPNPATKAGLQTLQKNLSYLFSRPTVGNKTVTFTAVTKPTIPLTFSVIGGVA